MGLPEAKVARVGEWIARFEREGRPSVLLMGARGTMKDRGLGTIVVAGLLVLGGVGAAAAQEEEDASARYRDLASVQAFERLRAAIDEKFEMVLADAETEREAWDGMRALLRILAMSTDTTLDANPKAPHFARMDTAIRKVGGDNPDAEYDHLTLDNEWDYVIRGNIGTVRHVGFTILGPRAAGRSGAIAYLNEQTLGADANGDFEIYLTKEAVDHPNWIDTRGGISSILVRQYIGDREQEVEATYEIEVLGREPYVGIPYSTDREVAQRIAAMEYGFRFMTSMHRTILPELFDRPNQFVRSDSGDFGADISSKDNLYMLATYQVGEGEALIIETDPLDVRYWNLAVESRWHETVDYRTRRTHRSLDHSVVDEDGKLRFVLAHGKTPHPNWLDTGGYTEGFLTFRWVGERDSDVTLPTVTRVKRNQVEEELAKRTGGATGASGGAS